MKTVTLLAAILFTFIESNGSQNRHLNYELNRQNFIYTKFTSTKYSAKPNHVIVFQLSSPHHFIEGCEYWVTLTVAYVFDEQGNYLGPVVSNPVLNYNCGYSGPYYTRGLSVSYSTDTQSRVSSLTFGSTGDGASDSFLSGIKLTKEIELLINDNIPRP